MPETAGVGHQSVGATAVQTDPSNVEQLRAWDGDRGSHWATHAERYDQGVAGYQDRFLAAAAIGTSETVLDIGCGTGRTTRDAARRATAGSALGVDLSSRMIALARGLAERERVGNATFRQADVQVQPFPERHFDVAVSRHGSMFFGDAPAAFANIARSLRPGGRLVLLTWQPARDNEWISRFGAILAAGRELPAAAPDAPGPFSLSDPERVRRVLTAGGFTDVHLQSLTGPMYFGSDPEDACRFVAGQQAGMLRDLDAGTRARTLDALLADMAEHRTDRGVLYGSATWLIQARRG
jgi:SAM-dependent methyltransferase